MDFNWLYIVPILFVLILIHEWGHFASARKVGIKVEEFGFGLPPRLAGFVHDGVVYSINALPIGGFVRMLGEDRASDDPASFNQKKPWERAFVTVAGATMNFIFAVLLLIAVSAGYGRAVPTGQAEITSVQQGSPAAEAGWRPGDVVVAVGGTAVTEYRELTTLINQHRGQSVQVEVLRDGQRLTTTVSPRLDPPPGQGATGVMIGPQVEYVRQPIWEAVPSGFASALRVSGAMLQGFGMMFQGLFNPAVNVGPVAGPIGMGQFVGEAVNQSPLPLWVTLANLTALLSLNLFLVNLLPLPALDGGRLLFILIEVVRGRRINPNREGMIHLVGLVVLLALIMVISVFDIGRLMSGRALLP